MRTSLDQIKGWLKEHLPNSYQAFRPGLDLAQIKAQLLPFSDEFPEELLTLYQWHDGMDMNAEFFPGFTFYPLEEALAEYALAMEVNAHLPKEASDAQWQKGHLPIFGFQGDYYYLDLNASGIYPVYLRELEETQPFLWFTHLSNMMKTLAAALDIGAIYLDEDDIFTSDEEAFHTIRQHFNPSAVFLHGGAETLQASKKELEESEDGVKLLKTWYGENHRIEERYNAEGFKIGQAEFHDDQIARQDTWVYTSPTEVEITAEHYIGMMSTKTYAEIDSEGQVHPRRIETYVQGEMVSEQDFESRPK